MDKKINRSEYRALSRNCTTYERKRSRIKLVWRLRKGIAKWWCLVFVLIMVTAFVLAAFRFAEDIIIFIITSTPIETVISTLDPAITEITDVPVLISLLLLFIIGLTVFLFTALMVGLVAAIGTPAGAKEIEDEVAAVLITVQRLWYRRPFLISANAVPGTDVTEYVFWSRWIAKDVWKTPAIEEAIFTAMDCTRVGDYRYGTRRRFVFFGKAVETRHIVIFRARPGADMVDRGDMTDDEI